MVMREISASRFKARCLALLDEVAEGGGELIVTKRGNPVARVGPVDDEASLRGTVTYNVSDEELIAPVDVDWEAAARPGTR
jgi:prevent-host-death family protein